MITGHNTDITYNGVIYHVQTEDRGKSNPVVETLVYKGGEILEAFRTSYEEDVKDGYDEQKIIDLIDKQHRTVIWEIKGGKYDQQAALMSGPLAEGIIDSKKTLDQVILEYLASEEEKDRMLLDVKVSEELVENKPVVLTIFTKSSSTGLPISGSRIIVKIISTVKKPITVHEGKTDQNGLINLQFSVPEFQDGSAALLVQAFSDSSGSDEVKQLIKKKKGSSNTGKQR
jgi:hypothetical protein